MTTDKHEKENSNDQIANHKPADPVRYADPEGSPLVIRCQVSKDELPDGSINAVDQHRYKGYGHSLQPDDPRAFISHRAVDIPFVEKDKDGPCGSQDNDQCDDLQH